MEREGTKLLVADDDEELRKILTIALERAGYVVVTAAHGEEALVLLERERPALVLLDIMMPGIDGLEVVRRMRGREDDLRDVPVIAFTALSSQLIEKELFDLGVQGFMRKPLPLKTLVENVDMELQRRPS